MTEPKPKNLGGRPKGSVDPLSAAGRRRMVAELYSQAQAGNVDAARALIQLSASAEKERQHGRK